MNPVFIIDREITFSPKYQDGNNFELFCVNPESMVTDFGMMIPLSADGFSILDYLKYGPGGPKMRYKQSMAVLITSQGDVRWLFMKGEWIDEEDISLTRIYPKPTIEGRLNANPVFWGTGNRRAFGFTETVQKLAFLSMEVKDKINDVLDFFIQGMPAPKTDWVTYNIDEIVLYLKTNRPSRPIPNSWSKEVVEADVNERVSAMEESLSKLSSNLDSMLETSL